MATALRRLGALVGWWDAFRQPGPRRILSLNSLIDATGTGVAAICLPFYLLLVVHLSAGQFAVVLSAGGIAELAAGVANGAVAGRIGVYRFVIITRLCHAGGFIALSFLTSFPWLVVLSVFIGAFRGGAGGLNQSLIASIVGEQRQSTLAVTRALRNIGYLCASALGALLVSLHGPVPLRSALMINGLTFLASAWLLHRIRPANIKGRAEGPLDWSVLRDFRYLGLIGAAAVFAGGVIVLDVALPLWVMRHHDVPRAVVAAALAINTVLVVLLQYTFSKKSDDVPGALHSIRRSAVALGLMAAVFVVASLVPGWAAVLCVLLIGVLLTFGEMYESPAWWTLSFELAPKERSAEYLATFDIAYAIVNIVGPPLAAVIVSHDVTGWIGYAAVLAAAALYVHLSLRTDPRAAIGRHVVHPNEGVA